MICNKSVANAVGGKSARACDSCIKKRARWYCAADDAFLCQSCDSSVHSANPLARRHERVRLKTASLKSLDPLGSKENSMPSWHGGFTRKARTPRHGKPAVSSQSKNEETIRNIPIPLVPEVGSDEISLEGNEEEHLLHRVPIFDPFAELCTTSTTISNEAGAAGGNDTDQRVADSNGIESKVLLGASGEGKDVESLHAFVPSDMDLADFAADMESLLGRGLENETFGMEELGLVDCKEENELEVKGYPLGNGKVKVEEEEDAASMEEKAVRECRHADIEIDMAKDPPFELSFDYDSPATCGEEDEKVGIDIDLKNSTSNGGYEDDIGAKKKRKILLSLDYEAVMTAWASQGSPWTSGNRPDFDPDACWPEYCMGIDGTGQLHHPYGDMSGLGAHPTMVDGGREARVSRYREKRRTRLFSKKIRYEVRKLNAEKRPRMKGRFVKRATFAGK